MSLHLFRNHREVVSGSNLRQTQSHPHLKSGCFLSNQSQYRLGIALTLNTDQKQRAQERTVDFRFQIDTTGVILEHKLIGLNCVASGHMNTAFLCDYPISLYVSGRYPELRATGILILALYSVFLWIPPVSLSILK